MPSQWTEQVPDPPLQLLTSQTVEDVHWQMQQVELAIVRRAYELFEARGCEHGHDWEDWFRAESELLRPVPVALSESNDWISVRVNVFGFQREELKVAVEPWRINIFGKKEATVTESEGGKVEYIDWYPDLIMKIIDLPAEIVPSSALIELQAGMLIFELPKPSRIDLAKIAAAA